MFVACRAHAVAQSAAAATAFARLGCDVGLLALLLLLLLLLLTRARSSFDIGKWLVYARNEACLVGVVVAADFFVVNVVLVVVCHDVVLRCAVASGVQTTLETF